MKSRRVVWVPFGATVWAVLVAGAGLAGAGLPQPGKEEQAVTRTVAELLEQGHISRQPLDDAISKRIHKELLELFDPRKLFFLQSDVSEFAAGQASHDDRLREGDLSFAQKIYERFAERLDARIKSAHELIDSAFDFAKEESIVLDPEATGYAQTDQEVRERWRKRIKLELLDLIVNGEPEAKARERLHRRYRAVARRYHQFDNEELLEYYLTAVTGSFDPHTGYMSAKTLKNFNISIHLSLEGIGALLRDVDGATTVHEVLPGGPAQKDGRLKPGDQIVGVGQGEDGDMVDTAERKLDDVVLLIRGKAGSVVRLEVIPADAQKRGTYKLTRQKIELRDREAKGEIAETPKTAENRAFRVGVIRLPSFYAEEGDLLAGVGLRKSRSATNDVRRILAQFTAQPLDGIIIDLRSNGGGLLSEAIDLTGLFIDEGPIVQVKDSSGKIEEYHDPERGTGYSGPLLVVVNRHSASASEIFAGAIQDYRRGLLVGDSSTHGKGTVQKVVELGRLPVNLPANSGALKLTMQQFYRVNGHGTQSRGVLPDVVLPSETDHEDFGEAKLEYALGFDEIPPSDYKPIGPSLAELISPLRELSAHRQRTQPELVKIAQQWERLQQRRARKLLAFSEALMRKEREEFRTEEADPEDPELLGAKKQDEKPFGSDPYTREVLAVMRDYLERVGANSENR